MMRKAWMDPDERKRRANIAFHDNRLSGRVNMLDAPQSYDPEGTVVAMIVDVMHQRVIRCALSRSQAKNLAAKLMEAL